jgi:hypothetical protein
VHEFTWEARARQIVAFIDQSWRSHVS